MKKVFTVVLFLLGTIFFVGCQKSEQESKEIVELVIPSYKTGQNVGAKFFKPQVERFNEKYAGIYKITLESVPEASFKDRLKQLAQQGKLPVLVQGGDFDWFKNVVIPNGLAYDLSSWLETTPQVKDILLEDGIKYCTESTGEIFSLPLFYIRPIGFFYNQTMYTPSGDISSMSMDQWLDDISNQKIALSTAENGWTTALFLTALIANEAGGVEFLQSGVNEKITDFNHPAFISAVEKLQTLLMNNASPNSIGGGYPVVANDFMSKQASIISNGSWMSTDFSDGNSKNWSNGFNGADVRASLYPGNIGIANAATYGEWWISADASAEEISAATAFLEFINSPEEIEAYLLSEGGTAPKVTYSETFKTEYWKTTVFGDLAEDTTEGTIFVPAILDVMPASVANIEFGKLLPSLADGSYSPKEFCEWLTQKAIEAVN